MRFPLLPSLVLALCNAPALAQTTWFVDGTGTPPGSGTANDPYTSILVAILAPGTLSGDTVLVAPGLYTEWIDFFGKTLTLRSVSGAAATTINRGAQGALRPTIRLASGEGPGTVIEGFTITMGEGEPNGHPGMPGNTAGGGVFCLGTMPTIKDCVLEGNWGIVGGALYARDSDVTMTGCTLRDNNPSGGFGGGVFVCSSTLRLDDCVIGPNGLSGATGGGGVFAEDSTVEIDQSEIADNFGNFGAFGGGLHLVNTNATVTDSEVTGNAGTLGGGIGAQGGSLTMAGTTVGGNVAHYDNGGGLYLTNCITDIEDCEISDNLETDQHRGGGAFVEGGTFDMRDSQVLRNTSGGWGPGLHFGNCTALISDCVIAENNGYGGGCCAGDGGGVYVLPSASVTIEDSIIRDNRAEGGYFGGNGGGVSGPALLRRCLIEGNVADGSQVAGMGGGVHGPATLEDCVLRGNQADQDGGATFGVASLTRCILVDNIAGDNGGGIAGPTLVSHCTVVANSASSGTGGAGFGVVFTSSIAWSNTPNELAGPSTALYSDVEGGWPGVGNIDADPRFWSLFARDLYLLPSSPCIDAANPSSPTDPNGTRADMGALPFDPAHCGPGCNGPIGASYCTANPNSSGSSAALSAIGNTSLAQNLVLLRVIDAPANRFGYFLMSDNQAFVPLFGGSQGNLCLGLPIVRFVSDLLSSGPAGEFDYQVDLAALPQGTVFQSGETWNFQCWFRDVNPQQTSNTSDGRAITWQ